MLNLFLPQPLKFCSAATIGNKFPNISAMIVQMRYPGRHEAIDSGQEALN